MLDQEEVSYGDGSPIVDESRRNLFKLAVAGSVASLITLKQNSALGEVLFTHYYSTKPTCCVMAGINT